MSIIKPMLKKELEKTAITLKIVRESKVVDAGAVLKNSLISQHIAKLSSEYFNKDPLFINTVSLVIDLHAGKGCVAIAARIAPE